jgi:hypothetical protein
MYTMYTRAYSLVVVSVFLTSLGIAGCGSGTKGGGPSTSCMPGTMSMPHAANDPCPQVGTACAMAGMVAVSTCQMNSTWSLQCACLPAGSGGGVAGASGGTLCGTPAQQCIAGGMVTANCMTLGMGTGAVTCDPATCKFNTSMCRAATGGGAGNKQ